MSTPKLKICGMLHPENIREVAALQPDYLGFIFLKALKDMPEKCCRKHWRPYPKT